MWIYQLLSDSAGGATTYSGVEITSSTGLFFIAVVATVESTGLQFHSYCLAFYDHLFIEC